MTSSPLADGLTVAMVMVALLAGFAGGSVGTTALLFDTESVDAAFGTAESFPLEGLLAVDHLLDPRLPTGNSWSAGGSSMTWSGDTEVDGTLDVLVGIDAASPATVAVGRDAIYDVLEVGADADLRIIRNGSTVLTPRLVTAGGEAWFVLSLEPGDHRVGFEAVAPTMAETTNATVGNVTTAGNGVDDPAPPMPAVSGSEANGTAGGSSTGTVTDLAPVGDEAEVAGEPSLGEPAVPSAEEATDTAGDTDVASDAEVGGTDPTPAPETDADGDGPAPDQPPSPSDEVDDDQSTEPTDDGADDGPAGSDPLESGVEPTDGDTEAGTVEPTADETLDGGGEAPTTDGDVTDGGDDPATDGDQDGEDGDPSTDDAGTSGDPDPDAVDGDGDSAADATDPDAADGDSADEESTTEAGTPIDDGPDDDGTDAGEQA